MSVNKYSKTSTFGNPHQECSYLILEQSSSAHIPNLPKRIGNHSRGRHFSLLCHIFLFKYQVKLDAPIFTFSSFSLVLKFLSFLEGKKIWNLNICQIEMVAIVSQTFPLLSQQPNRTWVSPLFFLYKIVSQFTTPSCKFELVDFFATKTRKNKFPH